MGASGGTSRSEIDCPAKAAGDSLRRVDSVGGGGELFGAGAVGECDTGADDTDYEFGDAGSEDSGGNLFLPRAESGRDELCLRDLLAVAGVAEWAKQSCVWRKLPRR